MPPLHTAPLCATDPGAAQRRDLLLNIHDGSVSWRRAFQYSEALRPLPRSGGHPGLIQERNAPVHVCVPPEQLVQQVLGVHHLQLSGQYLPVHRQGIHALQAESLRQFIGERRIDLLLSLEKGEGHLEPLERRR